jgi:hypothetical protein
MFHFGMMTTSNQRQPSPQKNTHYIAQLTVVGILVGLRVLTPIPYMLRT